MYKITKYGMSIHPGNAMYIFIIIAFFSIGLKNKNTPWWVGAIGLIFLVPLYVKTSYDVGCANWDFENNRPL